MSSFFSCSSNTFQYVFFILVTNSVRECIAGPKSLNKGVTNSVRECIAGPKSLNKGVTNLPTHHAADTYSGSV